MNSDNNSCVIEKEEDEELAADVDFINSENGEESEGNFVETFTCKYCEFETENLDDLDEHMVTHDEAFLDDYDEEIEEEELSKHDKDEERGSSNGDDSFMVSEDVIGNGGTASKNNKINNWEVKNWILEDMLAGNSPKQTRPAYYEQFADKKDKIVYVCPFCGYQTMKKLDSLKHLKLHKETAEPPIFACSECPYTTRRRQDMPKHLLVHCDNGTVPMYSCPECPYTTKRKSSLPKHMLCHKPARMYECPECDYASKRISDLKKHTLRHGIAPRKLLLDYKCTADCGFSCKRANLLHTHVIQHRDKNYEGIFKCVKCSYMCKEDRHFVQHVINNCQIQEMEIKHQNDHIHIKLEDICEINTEELEKDKMSENSKKKISDFNDREIGNSTSKVVVLEQYKEVSYN
ncbi:zinc finger protein piragua-like [Euwallacea similis]|uniref:zinc finger protein piragua-like n=1 Tax=Euwallacea similis TaxID=1736056 RepID=UPI0034510B6D